MEDKYLGENLIFLISQPRAGSTMLQRIIASHPLILSSAEPWLMLHPVYGLKSTGFQAEYDSKMANRTLQDFLRYYSDGEATYIDAIRSFAKVLYARALQQGAGEKYFLDKTPRYYFIIPELINLFPKAKFIFLIRNPLAVLNSIIRNYISNNNWPQISYYRNDLLLAPSRLLEGIDSLGNKAYVIHYENLVAKPKATISSLCQRLGLSFNADMLSYGDYPAPKGDFGDNIGVNTHKNPTLDSLTKWIHLGDNKQMQHFALSYIESLGSKMIERLGYNYHELNEKVDRNKSASFNSIVPWHIAIRPTNSWTRKEYLSVRKAMSIQEKGYVLGLFSFIQKNYLGIIRSILPV